MKKQANKTQTEKSITVIMPNEHHAECFQKLLNSREIDFKLSIQKSEETFSRAYHFTFRTGILAEYSLDCVLIVLDGKLL